MTSRHALIIGTSQYDDPTLARLLAPEADVRALARLLGDPAVGQFDQVQTVFDSGEAAARRAIASFYARSKPDDLLLLYFSGHGILDDQGRLYLAAKDTQHDLPQGTAISAAFITDGMDTSRSRRQILILDCCHSGAFARGARSATGAKAITQTTFEGVGYGRAVLTATDATQYAWEGEAVLGTAEHSVFTQHLIEGLRTGAADSDGDGEITLEELYEYVYVNVVKQTPRQTPRKWSYNQEGTLVIARTTQPANPRAVPLPAELLQSLEDPRTWVREGAVHELGRLVHARPPGLARSARDALARIADTDDSNGVRAAALRALADDHATAPEPQVSEMSRAPASDPSTSPGASAPRAAGHSSVVAARSGAGATSEPEPVTPAIDPASETVGVRGSAPESPGRATQSQPWAPVAILSLGWGAAFFAGSFIFWQLYLNGTELFASRVAELLILGLIGGAATSLGLQALRQPTPPVGRQGAEPRPAKATLFLFALGWMLTALIGLWLTPALIDNSTSVDAAFAWERAAIGAVGGAWTSLALQQQRRLTGDAAITVALGWAVGWSVSAFVGHVVLLALFGDSVADSLHTGLTEVLPDELVALVLPWVDAFLRSPVGLLAGLSSGWIMIRQLRRYPAAGR